MFGQRNHDDDEKVGAPAVPAAGALDTGTGIPDDHAVSQMLTDTDTPLMTVPAPAPAPAPSLSSPVPAAPAPEPAAPTPSAPAVTPSLGGGLDSMDTEELIRMKQEALTHLQPLVGTLQQNPEEEFRTLMMMIQATDDKTLLKKALDAAKKIGDDKVRAQAMLDVINEINYFTQAGEQN